MAQKRSTIGSRFKKTLSLSELNRHKVFCAPVHFVKLWVRKYVYMIQCMDKIQRQMNMGVPANKCRDWESIM